MEHITPDRVRLSVSEAQTLSQDVLTRIGYDAEEARIIADHVVDAALCGYEYSGLPKILNVVEHRQLRQPRRAMRALRETANSVLYDGGNNNGMVTMYRCTQTAIAKAREQGMAVVGVNNSWVSGRSAHYVEMVAHAKTRPGQINYATTSTNNLIAAELLNHMAGIKTVAISYKGTGQAVNALLGGEVQLFVISPLVGLPHVQAGKLRALGVTGLKRSRGMPDIPAIAETLPGYEQIVWHGIMAPAKMPKPIADKLTREFIRIIKLPDIHERFSSQGLDPVGSSPEAVTALIKQELQLYVRMAKQIGLKPM